MRISEIIALPKSDIHFKGKLIITFSAKSKPESPKFKRIPLTPAVEQIIRRRMQEAPSSCYVFALMDRWLLATFRRKIQYHLRSACKRAKIRYGQGVLGGLVFHDTRHTATSEMVKDRVDLGTIQTITGHSDA